MPCSAIAKVCGGRDLILFKKQAHTLDFPDTQLRILGPFGPNNSLKAGRLTSPLRHVVAQLSALHRAHYA